MRLGLDAFSLRWQGWTPIEILDFAATHGAQTVQFSERASLGTADDTQLRGIRDRAEELGIALEVGMRSIDRFASTFDAGAGTAVEQLNDMIRIAEVVGSGVVRCFMGMQSDRRGATPVREHIDETVRVLGEVAPRAEELGIRIGLENHGGGDLLVRELRQLIDDVGSPAVGACIDSGNAIYAGEDPLLAAEILAPVTITCQLRDARVWRTRAGAAVQWTPLGQGDLDLIAFLRVLGSAQPDLGIHAEVITSRAPITIDFLDPGTTYWECYPDLGAADFSRFLRYLQDDRPRPLDQLELHPSLMAPTEDSLPELRRQQIAHVAASLDWLVAQSAALEGSGETTHEK